MFLCLYHHQLPEYHVMAYLSLHLIAIKTLELVYENALSEISPSAPLVPRF